MDFDIDITTGEEEQATPAIDEQVETQAVPEGTEEPAETQDQAGNVQDAVTPQKEENVVSLEVVKAIREQNRELREQNQKILDFVLKGQQQQPQRQEEPEPEIDDGEFVDGKAVKQLLKAQEDKFNRMIEQQREQSQAQIRANQVKEAQAQYSDYAEVHNFVMEQARINPGIADFIMKSANPPAQMYKLGKYLMAQDKPATGTPQPQSVKAAVKADNAAKIQANLNQPKTLSAAKGQKVAATADDYLDSIWDEL